MSAVGARVPLARPPQSPVLLPLPFPSANFGPDPRRDAVRTSACIDKLPLAKDLEVFYTTQQETQSKSCIVRFPPLLFIF